MRTPARSHRTFEVFISCSHADKRSLSKLEKGLDVLKRQRRISVSHSGGIEAGKERAQELSRFMEKADIILLLVSSEFLASDFFYGEDWTRMLERHARGEAQLIPVILRPCDWESTEFGDFVALPDGARPVSDWPTQDEAFDSVVKAIRSLVVDGVKIGTSKSTGQPKKRIPDLLLCLCNRIEQEDRLSGIFSFENHSQRRPFVCIFHGNEEECHDMYKSRLQLNSLPRLLRGRKPGEFSIPEILLPFPHSVQSAEHGFRRLRDTLAEKVAFNRQASDEEIARALSQFITPVIIHSYLSATNWEPHCSEIVNAFLEYWSGFPDLPTTTQLFVCLFVIYRKEVAAHAQAETTSAVQRDGTPKVRDYINGLDLKGYGGIYGGVLPEMKAVLLEDAEDYFRDDECFTELCKIHSPYFCNVPGAVEDIRSYYEGVEHEGTTARVPMKDLAKELRRILERNLC